MTFVIKPHLSIPSGTKPLVGKNAKKAAYFSPQHQEAIARRAAKGGRVLQPKKADINPPRPITLTKEAQARIRAMVIHHDAHIIAFNKPSGLSSQGGRGNEHNMDDLLWAFAKSNGKKPRLVHRLDRDTSGLLLAAKTQPDAGFLGKAMIARQFQKTYICLVTDSERLLDKGEITVALRREDIGKEAYSRTCADDHLEAQTAHTDYEVLRRIDEIALVRAKPRTGRMHQLRVHFSSLGAPILGDVRYGGALSAGACRISRLMLHAKSLGFPHPDGAPFFIDCPMAEDMLDVFGALGFDYHD